MASWFNRFRGNKPPDAALRGTPPLRREKTYSADTGYVYQYYYEGYRESQRDGGGGHEHVFNVTSDRVSRFSMTLFLATRVLEAWQLENERELTLTERYAIVKLSLFEAFDKRTDLGPGAADCRITKEQIEAHTATLDL